MTPIDPLKYAAAACFLIAVAACEPAPVVTSEPEAPTTYHTEVVVPGSHFHGIHGLTFGPDGIIYVGSIVGMSIYKVDPDSGAVTTHIGPMNGQADDLEFGPDGTLAWTGFTLGKMFAQSPGGPVRELATDLYGINSTAFNAEGRLFGTQVFLGDALYEFDLTGETPPRKILEGMGGLNGFDFGPDGKLYGPLWFKGQIIRVDVETAELEVITDGFTVPAAVNFDSKGNLYAVDNETGEIFRIDIEAKERHLVATAPTNLDNLAIDAKDNIFVTNMSDNAIYEINAKTGDIRTVVSGLLTTPGGISADGGTLYVADTFSLSKVDLASGDVSDISRIISDHEYPTEVDASGEHIIMSSFNAGLVQAYDKKSGERLTRWAGFVGPTGVLELEDGSILVGEAGTSKLLLVSGVDGEVRKTIAEDLHGITDIVRLNGSEVLLSAGALGKIIKVNYKTGEAASFTSDLQGPEGLAIDADGNVLVAEVGKKRLIRIDAVTGKQTILVSDLPVGLPGYPLAPPSFITTGVTVAEDGTIYIASDIDNSILKVVADD
jgi:sugar lactone lactonase YvrE